MKVLKEKDLHVGMKIRVMLNVNPDAAVWGGYYLPVKIIDEKEHFFVCETEPHRNLNISQGPAAPYRFCINKINLRINDHTYTIKEYWPPVGKEAV